MTATLRAAKAGRRLDEMWRRLALATDNPSKRLDVAVSSLRSAMKVSAPEHHAAAVDAVVPEVIHQVHVLLGVREDA